MSDDNYSFDYPAINQSEIFTIVIGSLCSLFSASVVIILILRYELLMKGRRLVSLSLLHNTISNKMTNDNYRFIMFL